MGAVVHLLMEPASVPPPLPVTAPGTDVRPRWHLVGTILAYAAILVCVGLIVRGDTGSAAKPAKEDVTPNVILNLTARYWHGMRVLLTSVNQWNAEARTAMEKGLDGLAKKPVDRLRVEMMRGLIRDEPPDPNKLKSIEDEDPSLSRDIQILGEIQAQRVSEENWEWFRARHGWLARAVRAPTMPNSDPDRQALDAEGMRTTIVFGIFLSLLIVVVMAGIGLLVVFFLKWRKGGLRPAMGRLPSSWGGLLLEGFAIYLCGWTVVPTVLHHFMPDFSRWVFLGFAALVVPFAMLWPRWRGMDRVTWKQTLGMHTGRGIGKEMLAGLLGWVAAIPVIIGAAIILAPWIAKMTGTDMGHPIVDPLTSPGRAQVFAALLAVVWAPLAEEAMFRGLLFPGLSARMRWLAGALMGAFIFAVIHPQGIAAVPAIMAIAFAASMLRLVRGSLIAPMTLHALNNGTLVVLLILSMG